MTTPERIIAIIIATISIYILVSALVTKKPYKITESKTNEWIVKSSDSSIVIKDNDTTKIVTTFYKKK